MRTEHRDQTSFCPCALREVSVLTELVLGHPRYSLMDVPPQSNSPPGCVLETDHAWSSSGLGTEISDTKVKVPRKAQNTLLRQGPFLRTDPCACCQKHQHTKGFNARGGRPPPNRVSTTTMKVVVFHCRPRKTSHLCYASHVVIRSQTKVKLNRVFFPH